MSADRPSVTAQRLALMLDRYVRGGGNRETGAGLLDEILTAHDGDNLDTALHYWGFTR